MVDVPRDINARIAERVRDLRTEQGLSLDALAARSRVSRSMISLIERGESSPTATVLEKLAGALDVTMALLFDGSESRPAAHGPLSRRADQVEWKDPESGFMRRNLTPPAARQPFHLVEIHFPAGRRVVIDAQDAQVFRQVWMLEGTMDITTGAERYRLHEGDCLAVRSDKPLIFHNPGRRVARYVAGVASDGSLMARAGRR